MISWGWAASHGHASTVRCRATSPPNADDDASMPANTFGDLAGIAWTTAQQVSLCHPGFDDARLDTLFLAMPISWRGTLQQYVGRLHRLHKDKLVVRVYDYVDASVPVLNRMYEKRVKGYKAVGYTVTRPFDSEEAQADLRFAAIERIAVHAATAFEEARGEF